MKLFIFAVLIAVSHAGRLEHLEQQQQLRAYLPPSQRSFGAASRAHSIASGPSHPGFNAHAPFPSASNQYLPPDHGPSAGSSHAFEGHNSAQQFGHQAASTHFGHQAAPTQFSHPAALTHFSHQAAPTQFSHYDATPQGTNSFGSQARFQPQSALNRQYLAPHHTSEDIPQQPFDEQTGYHY